MADLVEHIMQFFVFAHLPPHLQDVSLPFARAASSQDPDRFADLVSFVEALPDNPERAAAILKLEEARATAPLTGHSIGELRKLLEAKDCAVRALVAKP